MVPADPGWGPAGSWTGRTPSVRPDDLHAILFSSCGPDMRGHISVKEGEKCLLKAGAMPAPSILGIRQNLLRQSYPNDGDYEQNEGNSTEYDPS